MSTLPVFTDLAVEQDDEGVFDILIADGDLVTTRGHDSAFVVSLFSDRRARADEVAEPMKRRGWIGDLVSEVPNDRHGSGIWLYEQRRLTPEVAAGVRLESEQALGWMVEDKLLTSVSAQVTTNPSGRGLMLRVSGHVPQGGQVSKAYALAQATLSGLLARI